MKLKIIFFFVLFSINFSFAQQPSLEYSQKFAFDAKSEKDPHLVLIDNYNHYLLTVIVTDGITAKRQMIIRKFDQKNVLIETFTYDFPKYDIATLYNYLGYSEGNGKLAVYTQTYSNKAKKSAIVKHVFDKVTAQFTSTDLLSIPILSAMKSGTVSLKTSNNKKHVGINYTLHQVKDQPETNTLLMLDATTFDIAWQKDFLFTDKFVTRTFDLTNSGKVVYVRDAKGFKSDNYFVLATSDGQQQMNLETAVTLQQPEAISIGTQDYVLAFNAPAKGLRRGDFSNLMLFDLTSGKMIQNAEVGDFNGVKDIKEVQFREIFIENDEITIYAEAKWEVRTPPTVGNSGGFGTAFPETEYRFGPAYEIKLSLDGSLKSSTKLDTQTNGGIADVYHSFGIVNVSGSYWANLGYHSFRKNLHSYYEFHFAPLANFSNPVVLEKKDGGWTAEYINQLMHYFPDKKSILLVKITEDKQLQLVNLTGIK